MEEKKTSHVGIRMSETLEIETRTRAAIEDMGISEYVRVALEEKFARDSHKNNLVNLMLAARK